MIKPADFRRQTMWRPTEQLSNKKKMFVWIEKLLMNVQPMRDVPVVS